MIQFPKICPACGAPVAVTPNHTRVYCTDDGCPSRAKGRFNKWTNTIGAKEFGPATIEAIVEKTTKVADLYEDAIYSYLATLDGFGEKSIQKMRAELAAHSEMTLAQFIAAFGIEDIGEAQAKRIIKKIGAVCVSDLLGLSVKDCLTDCVSDKTATKFLNGVNSLKDDMLATEQKIKIIANKEDNEMISAGSLDGKSFCFTGKAFLPRKELQQAVRDNGGVVFDTVKRGLDVLVLHDVNSTSTKAQNARKLGIQLMSEDDFVRLVGLTF